ncbi:MAG TPA: acetyl-CoA hydrolase/transferase C-terminal domain-containing protein [Geopsychrobacteraceae bacterium]|nr:acetyl-CoA hydrolase/transferase C-terminal domain-containing protein [Geopsychrobacteraceae bacterium]
MTGHRPQSFKDADQLVDAIIDRVGKQIRLALPLGLGKANGVANALVKRACQDDGISLSIQTALTLEVPIAGSELERRFLEPLMETFFSGYPELRYARLMRAGDLPDNISVQEFFLAPGKWLNNQAAQQNYLSVNYTHALNTLLRSGFNVLAQQIAPPERENQKGFSLSCNPDISVDLFRARAEGKADFLSVGQVNDQLPFMGGDAERSVEEFDLLFTGEQAGFTLFKLPHQPVSLADHAIGLQAASLVPDGGTLQVGIGSIGDAICHALLLRQRKNNDYRKLLDALGAANPVAVSPTSFSHGLYSSSEMLVEGFLDLLEGGILKREVDGAVLHAGFFVGSPLFYEKLRKLPDELRDKIAMMPVSFTNQLYHQEEAKRAARTDARFINSALIVTALGAVVSDGLENGQVVSGVGGQYDFVAMAFALDGARSVITLPATRTSGGRTESNIRWSYGHVTIPRHLRDIVITEYGIADLRDQSDAETIRRMLAVTDARFQDELVESAKSAGKLPGNYKVPEPLRRNTPEILKENLLNTDQSKRLSIFPLGSAFDENEERLALALQDLSDQAGSKVAIAKLLLKGWRKKSDDRAVAALVRMGLDQPGTAREWFYRFLLQAVLR